MLNCWWFAINFRWRSSPILFRFCRLSLPWYTLFSCIVGVFNNICCRSLKSAKRFSIANNCKKTNQIKRTRNKNRYGKKSEKNNWTEQRKTNLFTSPEKNQIFITVRNTKISGVFKRTNFTAIGKRGTLFVTRWLQVVTISYFTDSFGIIMMAKERFFFGTIMENKFKSSF